MLLIFRVVITAKKWFLPEVYSDIGQDGPISSWSQSRSRNVPGPEVREKGKGQAGEGDPFTDISRSFKVNNFTSFHFEINMVWNSMAIRKVWKPKNTTKPPATKAFHPVTQILDLRTGTSCCLANCLQSTSRFQSILRRMAGSPIKNSQFQSPMAKKTHGWGNHWVEVSGVSLSWSFGAGPPKGSKGSWALYLHIPLNPIDASLSDGWSPFSSACFGQPSHRKKKNTSVSATSKADPQRWQARCMLWIGDASIF